MLEDESDDEEVDGHGDAEDAEGGQDAVDTEPEKEVEQAQLQEVVEDVGSGEASPVAGVGMLAEGEVGREVVVGEEADDIAHGEGDVELYPVLQQPVDGIVDGDGQHADDAEAEQLAEGLAFEQIFDFHAAKVSKS